MTTMEDTATHFKCFPRSPYHSNKTARNSSPFWFFNLIYPSNGKINVISPQDDQVSNVLQTGRTVSKEEHERVLQERNSLKDQLFRKNEEINRLKDQVSRLNRLTDELWLLSDSNSTIKLSHAQDEAGSSSNNKGELSVTTAESNVVKRDQNKEKAIQDDKTQPVRRQRVERDIIGARASPLPPLPPPVETTGTRPTPHSSDSYEHIFAKIREENQLNKAKESAGLGGAGAAPIALAALARLPSDLCYTDIFHTLVARGLITPRSPETDGSGLYNHISYLQICEYHKGSRGHSTESCGQLRLQVGKLIRDGVIKVEPPNFVVFQNKPSVPTRVEF